MTPERREMLIRFSEKPLGRRCPCAGCTSTFRLAKAVTTLHAGGLFSPEMLNGLDKSDSKELMEYIFLRAAGYKGETDV